jgi:hypothetical protein
VLIVDELGRNHLYIAAVCMFVVKCELIYGCGKDNW